MLEGSVADVIAEVQKNANEVIRVQRTEYRGHNLIDVRVWYADAVGVLKPTRKGLSLQPKQWRELLAVLGPELAVQTAPPNPIRGGGQDTEGPE